MTEPDSIKLKIGRVTVSVPICSDVATTRRLAGVVTNRLDSIEEKSTVIDTQAFALQTALYFAAKLEVLKREKADEMGDILKALDKVNTTLQQLVQEHEDES